MSRPSDRNLLFGIVALQMDFISQSALIQGMQAWLVDKSRQLGDVLVERGSLDVAHRQLLEPLVDAYVKHHGGDTEQSLASLSSVSEVTTELQSIADADLQHALSLLRLRQVDKSAHMKPSGGAGSLAPQQRFGLLRMHAEGGLGRVWIATDRELNREVAFKEIKPSHAEDIDSRGRFVLEAEITGGLEHPGIVPVYSLGHHDNGRPFYAMRFIRGDSLKDAVQQFHNAARKLTLQSDPTAPTVIGQDTDPALEATVTSPKDEANLVDGNNVSPSPLRTGERGFVSREAFASVEFRQLLGRFVDVCNAIEYAHSRGVLHRDLKPGNIMLGKYGETLVVDWGLAKATGRADQFTDANESTLMPLSGSGVEQTQIGTAIGTPAYMSPEQAAGRLSDLGPATDVYSLGATLYHVLTGTAPFVGGTLAELLRRVQAGDFPKPSAAAFALVRGPGDDVRVQASAATRLAIPKPLEAICLKAMSLRPSDRYASTAALAADVERFLADEPVSAQVEPLTIRVRRWIKRHQTVVGSTAAAVVVATVTLSILVALVTGKNQQLVTANTEIRNANTEIRNANSEIRQQKDQIDDQNKTLSQTNQQLTIATTVAETKRAEAEASSKVAREQSQLALSTLNSVIFDLQSAFRDLPGGAAVRERLLSTALEKLDKVSTEFAAKSAVDRNTMVALREMAQTILQLGQSSPTASREEGRARGDVQTTPLTDPTTRSAVLSAERLHRRAHEIGQQLAAENPSDSQAQRDLSVSLNELGDLFLRLGRTDEALAHFQDGLEINRVLAEVDPGDVSAQRDLSTSFDRLGNAFLKLGRTADALAQFQDELTINRMLAQIDPSDAPAQRDLSVSLNKLGAAYLKLGRTAEALAQLEDGLQIRRAMAEADPSDARKQRDLSVSFDRLGEVFLTVGRTADALSQFQGGLAIRRAQAQADPNDAEKQRDLSLSFMRLGDVFLALGRHDDALTQYQASSDVFRVLIETDPNDTQARRDLSIGHNKSGDVLIRLGRIDDALTQFQAGVQISRVLAEADPDNAEKQRDLLISFGRLGNVFMMLGRTDDALTQFEDAWKVSRVLADVDPSDAEAQRDLSVAHNNLGDVFLRLGRTAEALAQFEDGMKIRSALADADPTNAEAQRDLSLSFTRLGDVFLKLGRIADAVTQLENGLKISRMLAEADPKSAEKQRDIMVSLYKLGEVEVQASRFEPAKASFQAGIEVLDRLIDNGQNVAGSQKEKALLERRIQFCAVAMLAIGDWDALLQVDAQSLPQLLILRATEMLKRGELAHAVQAGDKLRTLEPKDKNNSFNAACVYARCAAFVTKDKAAPTAADQAEHKQFLNVAIECLKESIAAGYDNFDHLKKDDDLKPLRGLPEFETLFPK